MVVRRLSARSHGRGASVATALVALAAGAPVASADFSPFREEAVPRGIDYLPGQQIQFGEGVCFADFDGDGDPDVVVAGRFDGRVGLYENNGSGSFTDRWPGSGIGFQALVSGISAADYDHDGDLDLHLTRRNGLSAKLFRNDGGFVFTDVTDEAGVGPAGNDGHGATWGDFDQDGLVDLYVANRGQPNNLFRNLGPDAGGVWRFEDVAFERGVDRGDDPTFQGTFFDYDHDGDLDLYLATDHGLECAQFQNHLFRNDGGVFTDVTDESGTEACLDAMCIAVGDFDGNGWPDLYATNTPGGHALMLNQGDGTFARAEVESGTVSNRIGWSAMFHDFDHDGHMDLYVCEMPMANRLFRHEGAWPATDIGEDVNVGAFGFSFTCAAADVDGDGDLDMLVMNRDQKIRLYMNQEGSSRSWAKFDAVSANPNGSPVGVRAEIRTGKITRGRQVIAGAGYKSQCDTRIHVGLADAAIVDEMTVTWPGGMTRSFGNFPVDRTYDLWPPNRLADHDDDGDRDGLDLEAMLACRTGDAPGIVAQGECTRCDLDGDFDVDEADLDALLAIWDGPIVDCDGDGVLDLLEIWRGDEADSDRDGHIDACDAGPADFTGDMRVDADDVMVIIEHWNDETSPYDLNGNGRVDFPDLLAVLFAWQR